jgi:transcriptional regulator with XRE-family HTH domain
LREVFNTVTAKPDLVRTSSGELPESNAFAKNIGLLCVQKGTNVDKLAEELKMEPGELLKMINGSAVPTRQVIAGLAKALDSDVRYLEKVAGENVQG